MDIRTLDIEGLRPIQQTIDLGYSVNLNEIEPPDVWRIKGKNYLVDGHHRVFRHLLNGKSEVKCKVYSEYDLKRYGQDNLIEEIVNSAEVLENSGISNIYSCVPFIGFC